MVQKKATIDTSIEELERGLSQPEIVVNSRVWQNIPIVMRDCDVREERNMRKMERLMQLILQILNECLKNDIPLINRRMLHSSLSTLKPSPTLPKPMRVCIGQCLLSLDSFEDGPFVLVDSNELKSMEEVNRLLAEQNTSFEQSYAEFERRSSEMTRHKNELEKRIKDLQQELTVEKRIAEEKTRQAEEAKRRAEEQKGQAEREKEKLSDEVKRTVKELGEAREGKAKSEREKREMAEKMEQMKATMPTAWVGTDSLQTLDRTAHRLTPTTLTQIIKLEKIDEWRTSFTVPFDEGEWELKIRGNYTSWRVSVFFPLLIFSVLGFIRHPLPENATQKSCGAYFGGIGGHFSLWKGGMFKAGKDFKPEGTNKKCDRVGQTAAIRVNMTTREARLFVDDEEQPGIFPDIPSPLCLGITTRLQNASVEVLWLKRR
ncbi:hypothetical protein BLNAU_19310 [Blattamonas nauphoetae]|uniref:SPRY domain-containing protein n=1 Tax=Blattamonas nauphoetae TaxID=2049346 RepID=A0ABQ9X1X3_9EUKA|nr:hypothetical protein BLNAU_19310 [Blattamonas nauphoetae]